MYKPYLQGVQILPLIIFVFLIKNKQKMNANVVVQGKFVINIWNRIVENGVSSDIHLERYSLSI